MLWDIQTGGLVRELEVDRDVINTLAFSPSGTTLVSCGNYSCIRVWNPASGNCDAIIEHSSRISSLCWISDTVVASSSHDGLVKLWDIPARRWLMDFSSHIGMAHSISCSADGSKLASAALDGIVQVYDVATGATLKTIPTFCDFISLSPKGDLLVCGSNNDLEIWDLSRDVRLTMPVPHGDFVQSACFSPDGTLIASAGGNTVKLWTTEFHGDPLSHSLVVQHMCFSEDGSLIASGSRDGTLKIWDATDCSCLLTLSNSTDKSFIMTSLVFSPDRTLVGGGCQHGEVMIWDLKSQKLRAMMKGGTYDISLLGFLPDGSKLVSISTPSSLIRVWDAETGSLLASKDTTYHSNLWMTLSDGGEIIIQADHKPVEKFKLCAVSTSSLTIGPSEEMEKTSTPFDLVLSTDDELTIQRPSPSYLLSRKMWDNHWNWIKDSQERRVFHCRSDASVSACHMRKLAVGTFTGRIIILDFSNVAY
jgi:WD40 repeat protein